LNSLTSSVKIICGKSIERDFIYKHHHRRRELLMRP
jgi:hypothetical protein